MFTVRYWFSYIARVLPPSLCGLVGVGGLCLAPAAELGDKADKPGVIQQVLVPRELIPPAPPLSPQEALGTFTLPPGYRMELVASEPLVGAPVCMSIGPDGRLWVVEMHGFMQNLDGKGEDAPVGVVATLEDTDGDGKMDRRTVFMDGLVMPRAVMVAGDGVLVGAPPMLWYCRDTDGDGRADERVEIANDFGVAVDPQRPEIANPERAPNSLLWSLDNWVYGAAYTRRFRYQSGQWISSQTTFRGQWGLSQDDYGRLYYNSNSDQLRVDVLPSAYLGRNPTATPVAGVNVNAAAHQFVWPGRVNPGINRGYQPEMLRDYKLKVFTAGCAPWVFRSDLLGAEWNGNAFVCEPAGNLVKRNLLTESQGTIQATDAYEGKEFLTSTDERFRPVNLYTGPEGALYVVDFHRGVLEHRISLTSYLRRQSEERGLDKPIDHGRIYRIVPEGKSTVVRPNLHRETPAQWVEHLTHTNSWWRMTAQQMLVQRGDATVVPLLQELTAREDSPLGRLHALWTLEGLGRLPHALVIRAMQDKDARVQVAGVRLAESFLKTPHRAEVLAALLAVAKVGQCPPAVVQQLALTLGEAADPAADRALADLVRGYPEVHFLSDAAISGLYQREQALLTVLLGEAAWTDQLTQQSAAAKFISRLTASAFIGSRGIQTEQLLGLLHAQPPASAQARAMLQGLLESARVTAKKPIRLEREPAQLAALRKAGLPAWSRVEALLTWPGKPGAIPEPPLIPLTPPQQERYALGQALYAGVCAACHQPHGLGLEGLAPPLVDSEWVLGSEQRLARIVLHGVSGPLVVKGRTYNLEMPGFGFFTDDQVAGLLTYLRREWDHRAAPIEPATVKAIRETTPARTEPWRQKELLEIP